MANQRNDRPFQQKFPLKGTVKKTLNKNPESVFAGYWDEEGKTREVIDPDGWYATGDLGKIDDDGYLQMRFPNIFCLEWLFNYQFLK